MIKNTFRNFKKDLLNTNQKHQMKHLKLEEYNVKK